MKNAEAFHSQTKKALLQLDEMEVQLKSLLGQLEEDHDMLVEMHSSQYTPDHGHDSDNGNLFQATE